MADNKTSLKQAKAQLVVVGMLAEKNLKAEKVNDKEVIRGDLKIQTSKDNIVTFNVFVNKFKKGTTDISSLYKGMETIMQEYNSIADVGKEEADYVRVTQGQINPNTYYKNGQEHYSVKYQSNFYNRFTPDDETELKAEFSVELFIDNISKEMVKDKDGDLVESGRVLVKGWMPTYNGIESLTLVAPTEDGIAEAVEESYEKGQTVLFYGNCVNTKTVVVKEIPVKIGKPKKEETITYKNEFVITGASDAYEDEEGEYVPYDKEAINNALTEREQILKEKEEESKSGSKSTTSSKPKASGRALPKF